MHSCPFCIFLITFLIKLTLTLFFEKNQNQKTKNQNRKQNGQSFKVQNKKNKRSR
jgi:hypothetical protein